MKKLKAAWICIAAICFAEAVLSPEKMARAMFGEDLPMLAQILMQAIQQVQALENIIGKTRETVSILNEMNRGVKEVLRLAQTAHVPLPKQVYDAAKSVDTATQEANEIYGEVSRRAPRYMGTHRRSGSEGLYIAEDAFEYSNFLDQNGERIKSSAIEASQSAATRLTAESVGVLIHAVSHSNRIEAKNLEINSSHRLEESARENGRFESFVGTHEAIEQDLQNATFPQLNSFDGAQTRPRGSQP